MNNAMLLIKQWYRRYRVVTLKQSDYKDDLELNKKKYNHKVKLIKSSVLNIVS